MELLILLVIYCLPGEISSDETTGVPRTGHSSESLPGFSELTKDLVRCDRIQPLCPESSISGSGSPLTGNGIPTRREENGISRGDLHLYEAGPSWASQAPGHQEVSSGSVDRNEKQQQSGKCSPQQELPCKICGRRFRYKSLLEKHMRSHSDVRTLTCDLCGENFKWRWHLDRHVVIHSDERPFFCQLCSKSFRRKDDLDSHIKTHSDRRTFSCGLCSKSFKRKVSLDKHRKIHSDRRPFSCTLCENTFRNRGNLHSHMESHSDERLFSCDICRKNFKLKADLGRHMESHSDKFPFSCALCGKSYKRRYCLNNHMKTHSEFPFSCVLCDENFRTSENLANHVRSHDDQRSFSCDCCGKIFKGRSYLNKHMKTHSDEFPFSCELCGKKFRRRGNLDCHVRSHSNERLFTCRLCSKSFKRKDHLTRHRKTHSNEQQVFEQQMELCTTNEPQEELFLCASVNIYSGDDVSNCLSNHEQSHAVQGSEVGLGITGPTQPCMPNQLVEIELEENPGCSYSEQIENPEELDGTIGEAAAALEAVYETPTGLVSGDEIWGHALRIALAFESTCYDRISLQIRSTEPPPRTTPEPRE